MLSRPADFARTARCVTAWPAHPVEWPGSLLEGARAELAELIRAITSDAGAEEVVLLVLDDETEASARAALGGLRVRFLREAYGDIWLRDTGPLFVNRNGQIHAQCFRTNGWGGKFDFPADRDLGQRVAASLDVPSSACDWILEGGAIEVDGTGMATTTAQCLLNPNRNPSLAKADIEAALLRDLGIDELVWIERGLLGDHTDGHIDNIARFIAPGTVVCMDPAPGDPNAEILDDAFDALTRQSPALTVHRIPSPGRVEGQDGEILPASYLNFYIANNAVAVPIYGTNDEEALNALEPLFPNRRVLGIRADNLLRGGGAFHCITQQQPEVTS